MIINIVSENVQQHLSTAKISESNLIVGVRYFSLAQRSSIRYYPLFWVDPCAPNGDVEAILKSIGYTYIPCKGAGQFIADYIKLSEKLENLAPGASLGPTIIDIRRALSSSSEPIEPLFMEFLNKVYQRLHETKPDFTKFAERDEAIVQQINEGLKIIYDFIEAAKEAVVYKNLNVIKKIYEFFGSGLKLYTTTDNFYGSNFDTDLDGFKFLLQEMFISFIAILIKYDYWALIRDLLEEELFVNKKRDGGYFSFIEINAYIYSLDIERNNRLELNPSRMSITADFFKERFCNSKLSDLLEFQEFMEADYFIFIYSICHASDPLNPRWKEIWNPYSSVYLMGPPSYLNKAESKRFLEILANSSGCPIAIFVEKLEQSSEVLHKIWNTGCYNEPLRYYNFEKLGTRR